MGLPEKSRFVYIYLWVIITHTSSFRTSFAASRNRCTVGAQHKSEYPFPVLSDSKGKSVFEPFLSLFVCPKPDAFAAAAGRLIPVVDFTNGYMVIPQRSAAPDQCGQNFSADPLSAVMGLSDDNGHIVLLRVFILCVLTNRSKFPHP